MNYYIQLVGQCDLTVK